MFRSRRAGVEIEGQPQRGEDRPRRVPLRSLANARFMFGHRLPLEMKATHGRGAVRIYVQDVHGMNTGEEV